MKKMLVFTLIAAFALFNVPVVNAGTLYDDGEIVIDSTNLYPKTDGGSTLGKSGNEFADIFTDSITLAGEAKTGWGTAVKVALTADTTATITVVPGTDVLYTYTIDTDNEDCTLTFSAGGTIGDVATIIFDAAAASGQDEIMTFHTTLANTTGTLTLADGANERYVITFISDGTVWNETSRTGAQT